MARQALTLAFISFLSLVHGVPAAENAAPQPQNRCKATPSSPGWPSKQNWSHLNQTLGGKLLNPLPPAIVCDSGRKQFSEPQCNAVGASWFLAAFHDAHPVSLHYPNWQGDACLPSAVYNSSNGCNINPFPKYTVNASDAQHVVEAIKFASEHNLRVSVKNTGHDFLGRSTSPEFSIWTHHLQGIKVHKKFKSQSCSKTPQVQALTAFAGSQFGDIYNVTKKIDVIFVGGAEPSVGLGGWLLGGGHSPLGAVHGLGVDNVLEMQVVTPSGDLVTANDCQNSDLFWAMKGGGGSTFGVLISATMQTFPSFPSSTFQIFMGSTADEANKNNNVNFRQVLKYIYQQIIPYSDNYINGYTTVGPADQVAGLGTGKQMGFSFGGYAHNKSLSELSQLLAPFYKKMNETKGVFGNITTDHVTTANDILGADITKAGAGYNLLVTSRLLPKKSLKNGAALDKFFDALGDTTSQALVVSGPAVRDPSKIKSTSVTPAWRTTYIHHTTGGSFDYTTDSAVDKKQHNRNSNVLGKALRDLAPNSGSYLNEADKLDPEWQHAFWGRHYPRLLSIKRKYDPQGIFWCIPCVGNEDWKLDSKTGELCRK